MDGTFRFGPIDIDREIHPDGPRPAHENTLPESLIEFWDRHTSNADGDADNVQTTQPFINGGAATASSAAPRPRNRNNSPGERARRRRRREAIVMNTGDRPISQQDIIQRS
jgi:hypothetical protein